MRLGLLVPHAVRRFTDEANRLYGVLNNRLHDRRYLAGAEYSIADMAIFPWLRSWKNQGIDWNDHPHLKGWFDEIAARPAVQRGRKVNRVMGDPASQLHERHEASDFDTKTQDKIEAAS